MDKVRNFLSLTSTPSYTITGTYSYYLEVSIKGDSPYQTSTISLTAFAKSDKKIAIAISCKWYRVHEDRQYLLNTIHSNTYQLSAEDLGFTLKVEVTSQEEDQKGTAIVQYGPIRLDPNVRSTLESILGAGGSRFPVQLVDEETGMMSKEPAAISMTSEFVRVVETPPVGKEKEVKFRYNYDIPKLELNYLDGSRMYFLFTGEEDDADAVKKFIGNKKSGPCKLGVKFLSRTSRDLVILALKCFATKTYLVNSMLINEVAFTQGKIFKDRKDSPQQIGDMLLEVDSIKREMYLVLLRNQELGKDKERLQQSVKSLEEELSSTIETYGQLINEVRSNSDCSQSTDAGEYKKKAEKLEDETKKLRRRIQEMEDEKQYSDKLGTSTRKSIRPDEKFGKVMAGKENFDFDKIRQDFEVLHTQKEEQNLFSLEYEMKLHDLEEENEKLKAKNENLMDELRQSKGRGSIAPLDSGRGTRGRPTIHDESLFVIENKISDTKKLNELLIKQVNDQKTKNNSLQKELDLLREEVSRLQEGEKGILSAKEKSYKEERSTFEKELQKLRNENESLRDKLHSGALSQSFMVTRDRVQEENSQLIGRMEALQKENNELRARVVSFEKSQLREIGSNLADRSMLNMSQVLGTPRRTHEVNFENPVNKIDEQFIAKFKGETENLVQDLRTWKAKCSGMEIEIEKLRRENLEVKMSTPQKGYNSGAGEDFMSSLDRSMANTSRTYEVLLANTKKENDSLYVDVASLRTKLTVADYSLQSAKVEIDRLRSAGNLQYGSEQDTFKIKKEAEILKEINERLKSEINSLKLTLNLQMSPQERDNILRERDQLRFEVEALKKSKENLPSIETKTREFEGKLNEKSREIEVLKAEIENYKTKNNSLAKEIDYLRNEVNSLRKKDESMLGISGIFKLDEYKDKYENLLDEHKKLEKEYNSLRKSAKFASSPEGEDLQQMNELLRKEILEYKKRLEESQRGSKNGESSNDERTVDEELRKRNKMLEAEVQNQRERIGDLEKENERLKFSTSVKTKNPHEESFLGTEKGIEESSKLKEEIERLKVENESLVQQRTQLSKKVESLGKELESKTGAKTNQAMLENFAKTNEKLIQENARLMDQVRNLTDEITSARMENSHMDDSRYDDEHGLKDKYQILQQELNMVAAEKDKLLVELSKMKAVEKSKNFLW